MRDFFSTVVRVIGLSLSIVFTCAMPASSQQTDGRTIAIAIQGGAGVILRENLSAELEAQYREKLSEAIAAGYAILRKGGSALDAVETSIRIMEDSPLFNAGKGAVFTHDGTNELDASIMDGSTLKAGAVAGVRHIPNPITLARRVMEESPHVMLIGEGAEAFAKARNLPLVDTKYFYTDRRWKQLQEALAKEKAGKDSTGGRKLNSIYPNSPDGRYGTVGCVALDRSGNLAAGTSTGGMTNKRSGRVGDAPIIGAGTYANNSTCAVSATGDGEYFIRATVAHDVSALMEYKGLSVDSAASTVIDKVGRLGGTGGVVALDRKGKVAMPFNTPGMYRAIVAPDGTPVIQIFKE